MIRDLNRHSDGIDESNQNSARIKKGPLGRLGRISRVLGPLNTGLQLMELIVPPQEEHFETTGTAWKIHTKCGSPSPLYNLGYSAIIRSSLSDTASLHGFTENCLAGQAIPADGLFNPFNPAYITSSYRSFAIGRTRDVAGTYRGQLQVSFSRPNVSSVTPYPEYKAAVASAFALPQVPAGLPSWPITAFPDEFPPLATPAFPDAIPWALAPLRPAPVGNNVPSVRPSQAPVDWSVEIVAPPVPSVSPQSGGKPPAVHSSETPAETPDRKDKERKLRMGNALVKAVRILSIGTEAQDTIDAIYYALPSKYRPRFNGTKYEKINPTYREKLKALYDHWDKVDLDRAVKNLIVENAKDFIYGKLGQVGGKISRRLGHTQGAGINSLIKRTSNMTRGLDPIGEP